MSGESVRVAGMVRSEGQGDRFLERPSTRLAALAAILVATTAAPALAQQPAEPAAPMAEEAEPILLEADTLTQNDSEQTITAEGDVQVRYRDRTMRANRLVYDLESSRITAYGDVELVEADGSIAYFDEVQVDEAFGLGVGANLRARLAGDASLAARTLVRAGPNRNELTRVIYTSCPICEDGERPPTWRLKARRAIQDRESGTISYRGLTIEALGVPVFWLPYFAHQDPSAGPHSGFLAPDFGSNNRFGAFYEQPYYWRISDYQDLTISPRVHSEVNPLLGLDYRKRFYSGDLSFDLSVTNEQDFGNDGVKFGDEETRGHIFGRGAFRINDYWDWGFGIERATDDTYLRRYDISGAGEERGPIVGDWLRLVSQVFAQGQDANSFASISAISFQGLRATDSSDLTPNILPTADYERVFNDSVLGGQVRWRSNAALLQRSEGADTTRVSSGVTWRRNAVFGPGWVISPFAETRADAFQVSEPDEDSDSFTRVSGLVGAEMSWPLMRPGEVVDLLIEPVVMAAYGSEGGDDERIVNEDSIAFELDDSNLFRPSATPNFDLWEPGGRLAVGVRGAANFRNGGTANFLFGRRFRNESAASTILTEDGEQSYGASSNLDQRASDYVAAARIDLGRQFGAVVRTRIDDADLEINRLDAEVRGELGRFSAYGRYFEIDDALQSDPDAPDRELTANFGVRLERGWRVQVGLRRDLDNNTNLRQDIRAIYEDDCTFLELAYVRSETRDRLLGPNEGFQIRIGLRTLGMLGGR